MRRALLALQFFFFAVLHAQTDIDGYLLSLGLPSGLEPLTIRFSAPQRDAKKKILLREGETFTLPGDAFLGQPPSVSWDSETEDDKYALLMFDQDAPRPVSKDGPGKFSPWLHWFVLNCRSTADSGHTLYDYEAPTPPLHTGPHRYILVLFKQLKPGQLSGYTQRRREKWPLKQFMEDNLNALMPVAATFFRAQTAEDDPKSPGYKSEL